MSFPITCTACHKTFTISDEIYDKKVAGRVVTIKCKSCSQGIRVDGTKGTATAAPSAPPVAVAAPQPTPAPEAVPADPLWAVDYPDGQDREFTTAEVVAELERGAIGGATLVWREGMAEWLDLAQVPELAGELARVEETKRKADEAAAAARQAAAAAAAKQAATAAAAAKRAAAAAAAAAAKQAPVHKPRAPMPTVTGLAGLPGAAKPRAPQPSTPELPRPRPPQPSTPELATPRAAQASSPELPTPFGALSSAPKAPAPVAVPAPIAAPPPMAAPPPPPPIVAPSPPAFAAALPAASLPLPPPQELATPPLPASVAKVVSRPPLEQPAFPAAGPSMAPLSALATGPALVADHATVEWPQSRSKAPLVIVLVLVVAAVIVGAVLLLGDKDTPPPATPISALPGSPGTPPAAAAAPASTTEPAAAAQPGADTATGSDPVAAAPDPGATPGAGFAELFAAGARKAESKGAQVAPTQRFDPAATKSTLAEAAAQAQACKQSGGPTGKVTVVVTFAPSGKAASATITDAPFAGTPTATCISAALKRASIPPFSGLPGTVSKTFTIL